MTGPQLRCPCGSGEEYAACCGRFHAGTIEAPTAEALMRSRFSAFARGDAGYLLRSWHPTTRPERLDLDPDVRWIRLEILDSVAGGPFERTGVVEFRAHHRSGGRRDELHERSRFSRVGRAWCYVDGELKRP